MTEVRYNAFIAESPNFLTFLEELCLKFASRNARGYSAVISGLTSVEHV